MHSTRRKPRVVGVVSHTLRLWLCVSPYTALTNGWMRLNCCCCVVHESSFYIWWIRSNQLVAVARWSTEIREIFEAVSSFIVGFMLKAEYQRCSEWCSEWRKMCDYHSMQWFILHVFYCALWWQFSLVISRIVCSTRERWSFAGSCLKAKSLTLLWRNLTIWTYFIASQLRNKMVDNLEYYFSLVYTSEFLKKIVGKRRKGLVEKLGLSWRFPHSSSLPLLPPPSPFSTFSHTTSNSLL